MQRVPSRDARSLSHATLEEMRRIAISRVQGGESQRAVAASLQVHWNTVAKWMRAFRQGGLDAVASRKASGPKPKLTERQIARVRRTIIGKDPRQLNFGVALWTLPVVAQLIERQCAVALHETTVGRLLRRLGLTPQRPVRRSFLRDEEEIRAWMSTEFPAIVRQARRRQATLLFADEAGVHEDAVVGRTWGERGETPVVRTTGTRRRVNVISAISPRGRLWFRCFQGTLTAARFIAFLQDLRRDVRGKIVLVLDRHPAHRADSVLRYLHEQRRRITAHFLPGYAPELNPDEHVWAFLKGSLRSSPVGFDESMESAVEVTLQAAQENRTIVRKFFDHPDVRYVKDALGW